MLYYRGSLRITTGYQSTSYLILLITLISLTEETNNLLLSKISNISEYFKLATLLDEIDQEIRTAIKA